MIQICQNPLRQLSSPPRLFRFFLFICFLFYFNFFLAFPSHPFGHRGLEWLHFLLFWKFFFCCLYDCDHKQGNVRDSTCEELTFLQASRQNLLVLCSNTCSAHNSKNGHWCCQKFRLLLSKIFFVISQKKATICHVNVFQHLSLFDNIEEASYSSV